jgi:hypothetical protein
MAKTKILAQERWIALGLHAAKRHTPPLTMNIADNDSRWGTPPHSSTTISDNIQSGPLDYAECQAFCK